MAGASRPVVAGDSLLVFPKTWRRRLAVRGAGVADRGRDDELRGAPPRLLAPAARPDVEHVAEVVALLAADAGPPGQPVFLPAGRSPAAHGDPDLRAPEAGRLASWPPSARRRWAGAEGRGSEQGAEAARQATGAAGSRACPKTGRRRLALWRAGVADRGRDESSRCAAGRDRGERRAGGQRTVSAAPETRRPGPAGWRDRSSTLSRACCGLRRWTMSGALFCPHCRPAPSTHRPSCAQLGPRCGAFDLPPARAAAAVGSRVEGKRRAVVCESPST